MKKFVFGTWSLSGDYGYKNEKETIKTLSIAYKEGIIQYDTAPNYGSGYAEYILGKTLSKKKNIKFNTKIGNNHSKQKNFNLKELEKSFLISLKNLKKINILFLHNPRDEQNITKLHGFLNELKKSKLINNFGISLAKDFNYKKKDINRFNIFQIDYNLLNFSLVNGIKQKKIYARSPLASGLLSKNLNINKLASEDHRINWLNHSRLDCINKQKKFLQDHLKNNLIFESIHFIKKKKFIDNIIFGIRNTDQLNELVLNYKKRNNTNFDILIKKIKQNSKLFLKKGY